MSNPFRRENELERALHQGVGFSSPLWTAVWFSVGVGLVGWWWTRVGRGLIRTEVMSTAPVPLPAAIGDGAGTAEIAALAAEREMAEAGSEPRGETAEAGIGAVPAEPVASASQPAATSQEPAATETAATQAPAEVEAPEHAAAAPRKRKPKLKTPDVEEAISAILATPPEETEFDPGALATETSVAALTGGEALDATAAPELSIGEPAPPPAQKRTRRKPGTAPEA